MINLLRVYHTYIPSSEVSFNLTNEMKLSLQSVYCGYEYHSVTQRPAFPKGQGDSELDLIRSREGCIGSSDYTSDSGY